MKAVLKFVFVLLSAFSCSAAKQPLDDGFVIIDSLSGLSNRLRVLAAHMYIAEVYHRVSNVVMVWDINDECPGHFLEIFQPIVNVTFIARNIKSHLEPFARASYPPSYSSFPFILLQHNITLDGPTWHQEQRRMYGLFRPVNEVHNKVTHFVRKYGICNASAMHVRRTDLDTHPHVVDNENHTTDADFFNFVESRPANEPVFLMTDNPSTQFKFLRKYGSRKILVYSLIPFPAAPSRRRNSVYRFTTLHHAIVDVLIAAHAYAFKGSFFSSMSSLVEIFSNIYDKSACVSLRKSVK